MLKSPLGQAESGGLRGDQQRAGANPVSRSQRARCGAGKRRSRCPSQSWLGPGANQPITAEQLKAIIGNSQVQDFARKLGLPVDETLKTMAQYLPDIVDKASPNGTIKPT